MTDTNTLAPTQTGEYPKLPEPAMFAAVDRQGNPVSHGYSASQVLALIDADRAARGAAQAQDALKETGAIAVSALETNSRYIADWREDMDRIAAIADQKGGAA